MRLVCPNCDAEYEVDASVIPDTGRDVQCSNCGHAWFQLSPRVEEELAAEEALFEAPPPEPGADLLADEDEDLPPPPQAAAPQPRALDESVLSVLREEAERETAARRAEAPAIESQTEMGLGLAAAAPAAPAPKPAPAPEPEPMDPVAQRIAKMKGVEAPPKPQSRKEMLPEIDEINSTLRASSEKREGQAGAVADTLPADGARGFRSGFVLMILLAVIVVALYVMAPKLSQQIPGIAPILDSYVAMIDKLRLALDGLLQRLIGTMRGAS